MFVGLFVWFFFFASVYPKVQLLHNLHLKLYRKKSAIILEVLIKFISKEKMVQCILKKQNKNTQIKAFNAPNPKFRKKCSSYFHVSLF